jgi:hypothetical protein
VKPKFVVTPEDVDVQDGSSARLDCEVTGYPRPVITWTFNDGPVDRQRTGILYIVIYTWLSCCPSYWYRVSLSSSSSSVDVVGNWIFWFSSFFICDFIGYCSLLFRMTELLANGGLVIRQVRQRDAGTYRCTGGNTLGKISAPAQLRVLSKWHIKTKKKKKKKKKKKRKLVSWLYAHTALEKWLAAISRYGHGLFFYINKEWCVILLYTLLRHSISMFTCLKF